jgi:FAD/FMN-containing dehydrogenase
VIPLPRMGEYTDGIERINIELSPAQQAAAGDDALKAFFAAGNLPLGKSDDAGEIPSAELLEDRVQQALALLREVRALWQGWLRSWTMWSPGDAAAHLFASCRTTACAPAGRRRSASRCSSSSPARPSRRCWTSASHPPASAARAAVWVALHMHAGDGNVHTNIPVNSDNYEMLQTAHEAVARIMALARSWTA